MIATAIASHVANIKENELSIVYLVIIAHKLKYIFDLLTKHM